MIRSRPPDRAANRSARDARYSARGRSRRQVAGGQPSAMASRTTSSLESSLRSMLRWRGDLVEAARTCSATLPSTSRGTSTWPRVPRSSRSRPHSSESAWRSATQSSACRARARSDATYGGAAPVDAQPRLGPADHAQRPPALAVSVSAGRRGCPERARGGDPSRARHGLAGALRTSSRNASERASRSSATRTKSRSAASVSRSMAGARRSVAMASMSRRW